MGGAADRSSASLPTLYAVIATAVAQLPEHYPSVRVVCQTWRSSAQRLRADWLPWHQREGDTLHEWAMILGIVATDLGCTSDHVKLTCLECSIGRKNTLCLFQRRT